MIKLITLAGITSPHFACDSCGQPIAEAGKGAAVFANFVDDGTTHEVHHVHKNFAGDQCMAKVEEKIRAQGNKPGWVELRAHVSYLVASVGITGKDVDRLLSEPGY